MFRIQNESRTSFLQQHPKENIKRWERRKELERRIKISMSLGLLLILFILFIVKIFDNQEEVQVIKRGDYLSKSENVKINFLIGDKVEEYFLPVEARTFGDEELDLYFDEVEVRLEELIRRDNSSLAHITTDLYLPETIEGTPFDISWSSSNCEILSKNGKILTYDIPEQGIPIELTASIDYEEYERHICFQLVICKRQISKEEEQRQKVIDAIQASEANSREMDTFTLPEKVDGVDVIYMKNNKSLYLQTIAGILLVIMGLFFLHHQKQVIQRNQWNSNMEIEYPDIVAKLSLLLCAGYTMRNSWEKIVEDGKKEGKLKYAKEQMECCLQKMRNGIPETLAYEEFGRQCGLPAYRKLGQMMSQNLKRGNEDLRERMKEEVRLAYQKRRYLAKEKSEKIQTMILVPMMLLLFLVLTVLVLPIFLKW